MHVQVCLLSHVQNGYILLRALLQTIFQSFTDHFLDKLKSASAIGCRLGPGKYEEYEEDALYKVRLNARSLQVTMPQLHLKYNYNYQLIKLDLEFPEYIIKLGYNVGEVHIFKSC